MWRELITIYRSNRGGAQIKGCGVWWELMRLFKSDKWYADGAVRSEEGDDESV